jgi:hypothetical protein
MPRSVGSQTLCGHTSSLLLEGFLYRLGMPAPELTTYSIYSVIAEKFETIVKQGIVNSRLKDYFDLWFFSSHEILDGHELQHAIANTFTRGNTALPDGNPIGLTAEFFIAGAGKTEISARGCS